MVTAMFFKDEESFLRLCRENGKISNSGGDESWLIIFRENCQFSCGPNSLNISLQNDAIGESSSLGNAGIS